MNLGVFKTSWDTSLVDAASCRYVQCLSVALHSCVSLHLYGSGLDCLRYCLLPPILPHFYSSYPDLARICLFKGISCHVVFVSCSVVQNAASSFGCPSGTAGTPGLFTYLNAVMMSMSMSTGVDPVMHAVSPFTMLISQLNGLASQCMFVLLSGAVFARLSQPSQPVVCAEKALLCTGAADTR
jgi:hypothetical protein